MSQTEKKVSMFRSQCLDKHIASQPLNRANGMSHGELTEVRQLQRLTRNAEVMGPRLLPLSALPDPQERSAWLYPTLQSLRNQPPSALLLVSRSASCYEYVAVIRAAHTHSEPLLGDSCWLEPSIFSHHKTAFVCEHVVCWELSSSVARGLSAPHPPQAGSRSGKAGLASEEKQ